MFCNFAIIFIITTKEIEEIVAKKPGRYLPAQS